MRKVIIPPGHDMNMGEGAAFPIDALPALFADIVNHTRQSLNYPTDYTGTAILAAVSTAIGKGAKLRVKSSWFEYAAVYAAIVGGAGASKSHPLKFAYSPFSKIDKASLDKYAKEIEEYEMELQAIKAAKKGTAIRRLTKPILQKTVMHDFSPEILCQRLADNPRGCAIVSDELATFLDGMNNYSKGDRAAMFLSFWSNQSTSVDRVKTPVPVWVNDPYLTIIGSIQPRVLPKLFPTDKTDNGFLQRFLFAFPADAQKQPINDSQLPDHVAAGYADWISRCIDTLNPTEGSQMFGWAPAAKSLFYDWQTENTKLVNMNQDSVWGEILNKFDIQFCRLSLIIQIMSDLDSREVSIDAVESAAKLCTYFKYSAMKVLDALQNADPTAGLPDNKLKLFNALPDDDFSFNTAVLLGSKYGMVAKTVQRFLADSDLFKKPSHGQYSKTLKS